MLGTYDGSARFSHEKAGSVNVMSYLVRCFFKIKLHLLSIFSPIYTRNGCLLIPERLSYPYKKICKDLYYLSFALFVKWVLAFGEASYQSCSESNLQKCTDYVDFPHRYLMSNRCTEKCNYNIQPATCAAMLVVFFIL